MSGVASWVMVAGEVWRRREARSRSHVEHFQSALLYSSLSCAAHGSMMTAAVCERKGKGMSKLNLVAICLDKCKTVKVLRFKRVEVLTRTL